MRSGAGRESVPLEDRGDRALADLVAEMRQGPLDASVPPIAVLPGQSHDQGFEFTLSPRPASAPPFAAVVLLSDQLAVPGEQRLRRHEGGHLRQDGPPQPLRFGGQPAALIVGEPKALGAKLLAEDSILLAQVLDHLQLALVHPAGDGDQQESEWIQQFRHLVDPILAEQRG